MAQLTEEQRAEARDVAEAKDASPYQLGRLSALRRATTAPDDRLLIDRALAKHDERGH